MYRLSIYQKLYTNISKMIQQSINNHFIQYLIPHTVYKFTHIFVNVIPPSYRFSNVINHLNNSNKLTKPLQLYHTYTTFTSMIILINTKQHNIITFTRSYHVNQPLLSQHFFIISLYFSYSVASLFLCTNSITLQCLHHYNTTLLYHYTIITMIPFYRTTIILLS